MKEARAVGGLLLLWHGLASRRASPTFGMQPCGFEPWLAGAGKVWGLLSRSMGERLCCAGNISANP